MGENALPVGKFSAWLGRVLELTFTHFSFGEHSIMINGRNGYVAFISHINHTEKNSTKYPMLSKHLMHQIISKRE